MILESYELLFLLMAALPGIYLATKKNFLHTPNPKYNLFILRLLFTVPLFILFNGLVSSTIVYTTPYSFPSFSEGFVQTFGYYAVSVVPLFFSIIIIIIIKKYLPAFDIPSTHKNFDLYLYIPADSLPSSRALGTKCEIINKSRGKEELLIRSIVGDLIIDGRYMRGKNISIELYFGAIIVTEEALEILKEENLSGFYPKTVKIVNGFSPFSKWDPAERLKCYQLACNRLMPKLSPLTMIKISRYPLKIAVKNKFYYHHQVLSEVSDFNLTAEYFGSEYGDPHFVQRNWIITKKARDVLINRLGQEEANFKPVYLVDDDGNVIDS
jgi:hypothetical protein